MIKIRPEDIMNKTKLSNALKSQIPEIIRENPNAEKVYNEAIDFSIKAFNQIMKILLQDCIMNSMIEDCTDFMKYIKSEFVEDILKNMGQEERFKFLINAKDPMAIDIEAFKKDMKCYETKAVIKATKAAINIVPGLAHLNITIQIGPE